MMAPPYHSMHRKLENVIAAFLRDNEDLAANVYGWLEIVALGEGVAEPWVGIRCRSSVSTTPEVQLVLGSGSRVIQVSISVRSHALHVAPSDDPLAVVKTFREVHDELVGKVIDCFFREDLIEALNAQAAVVGGIEIEQVEQFEMTDEPADRSGVTEIVIPITCHPKEW